MVRIRSLVYTALVLAVLVSTQGLLMTQAAFTLRRDYIAERLCVNRDNPDLDCHGHCYVTRKAQEERERQQERQTMLLELALSATMFRPEGVALPVAPTRAAPEWAVVREDTPSEGVAQRVFHPPRVG